MSEKPIDDMPDSMVLEGLSFGRIAYDSYCRSSKGKSLVTRVDLPPFDDLPVEIQAAWIVSAMGVIQAVHALFELKQKV